MTASRGELDAMLARHTNAENLAFPEERRLAIRMTDHVKPMWALEGASRPQRGDALRGESYALKLGARAARLEVRLAFTEVLPGRHADVLGDRPEHER